MCGVVGFIAQGRRPTKEEQIRVRSVCDLLSHRGPDNIGFWSGWSVALGHTRLSILDLRVAGNQPMHCVSGRYVIVFNGEIYNFLELRKELVQIGYSFVTDTDTEIIAAAYDAWGIKGFNRFNGMWAFALWDAQKRSLILGRDRYGVKPLYYVQDKCGIAFSSEIKALHAWLGPNAKVDEEVISYILAGARFFHGTPLTHLKKVFSVPAGHVAVVEDGNIKLIRWYEVRPIQIPRSLEDQTEVFRELFIDACKLRLRSDVDIASCLSGGIDSTSIASVLQKVIRPENLARLPDNFHGAYCASFPGTDTDESELARLVATDLGIPLNVISLSRPEPYELENAMRACDGPMPNLAFYPIWELYRFIRESGIKVALDGMGADEMLGGYRLLHAALPTALSSMDIAWMWDVYRTYRDSGEFKHFSSKSATRHEVASFVKSICLEPLRRLKSTINGLSSVARPSVYEHRFATCSGEHLSEYDLCRQAEEASLFTTAKPADLDRFQKVLFGQFFQDTLPMLLNQYDRCSMAHGVESRMPFMDYRLVEFVFSLPNSSRVGGGYTKRILREAMHGILNNEIRQRKMKLGFHPPQVEWFTGPLNAWMHDIVGSQDFIESCYFDGRKIKSQFDKLSVGASDLNHDSVGAFWAPVHVTWWLNNRLS
jgi:asparagine synthase (glutamine-hydrolysing)